jgi:hypothetical protein
MAGVVHIPWYATVFRGDQLEEALKEIAPIAMRYGATAYTVHRSRDDRYKFDQMSWFSTKEEWVRYWDGPDFIRWRAIHQGWFQVPVLYAWFDDVISGTRTLEPSAAE